MGENTFGYRQPETAGTYWRRRFIILMIGFAAFGLAAWALSITFAVREAPGHRSVPAHRSGRTGPAGSVGRSGGSRQTTSRRLKSSQPDRTRTRASISAGGKPANPTPAITAGQATGHGKILPAFCAKSDIVLSLFTGQTQFGTGQRPAFDVNVVSTQEAECTFNIGSAHLALVIKEGPALIWSSADCAAGAGGLDAALRRGVPTVLAISWNRQTSAPGCSSRTTRVPPGVYTAYAVEGQLTSQLVTFRLHP